MRKTKGEDGEMTAVQAQVAFCQAETETGAGAGAGAGAAIVVDTKAQIAAAIATRTEAAAVAAAGVRSGHAATAANVVMRTGVLGVLEGMRLVDKFVLIEDTRIGSLFMTALARDLLRANQEGEASAIVGLKTGQSQPRCMSPFPFDSTPP